MEKKMVGLVVLFTQPARRAKANRADGQQGQQPFHRERVARLGNSGVLYGRGLGGSRSRGRGGRGRSDRRRNNGGHAVPLGVQDDIAGNSAVKAEAVLAALLGVPAAEHPAVLFGGGRLAGLVAAYKGLAGNIGPAMPAQVKADRYQLVPLGGEGNIVVNGHSIARSVLVAGCILPTGKLIPGTAGVSSNGSDVATFWLKIVAVAVVGTFGTRAAVQVIMEQVLPLFLALFGGRFGLAAVVASLCAGAGTIQQMLVPFSWRPAAPIAGVDVGLVVLAIGVAVGQLFTGGENEFAIQIYIGTAGIVGGSFAAETKYLRAGDLIPGGGNIGICNVQDVLVPAHVGIVDVQSGLDGKS